ncbi:hypothetical protein ES703_99317 [subsurface metagenome]
MIELFQKGGPMMWGLLAVFLIGLTFIIERFITLLIKARLNPMKFMDQLTAAVDSGGVKAGRELAIHNIPRSRKPSSTAPAAAIGQGQAGT